MFQMMKTDLICNLKISDNLHWTTSSGKEKKKSPVNNIESHS